MRDPARPWHLGDRLAIGFLSLVGLGGIALSWWRVAGAADWSTQLAWVDVGVTALIVAAVADAGWLMAGQRALRRRKRALIRRIENAIADTAMEEVAEDAAGGLVCTAPRMTTYHRPDCLLVQGKPVHRGPIAEANAAGRRPCRMCTP
jgi:hypothetical protein